MEITIDKKHIELYNKIASDVNKTIKKFKKNKYFIEPFKYKKLLEKKNLSIEKKKKQLIDELHNLIIKIFSLDIKKIKSTKAILDILKNNIEILRFLINKLRDVNYYLQTFFLEELGLIKKLSIWQEKKTKEREIDYVPKKELEKIEHTVYELIAKVIFLDKSLLKKYKAKEEKIIKRKKLEIKDLEKILKKQSELLCHIESKLPPKPKIKTNLLKKTTFTHWSSRIFALLAAFENEYNKETDIFKKLKQNEKIKKIIEKKIKHLIKEKWQFLKIKEKRALSMEIGIDEEHLKSFHNWASLSNL